MGKINYFDWAMFNSFLLNPLSKPPTRNMFNNSIAISMAIFNSFLLTFTGPGTFSLRQNSRLTSQGLTLEVSRELQVLWSPPYLSRCDEG
jgi:hypothetical protein